MGKGALAVVSGFSGVGKGTLVKGLLSNFDNYALSISATTRKPREGEVDGREYFFISNEEFEKRIAEGRFLEYTRYVNHYYGTPKEYVLSQIETGKNIILEIEMEGGLNVKKAYPDAKLIFVAPPDFETLRKRLLGRATETAEEIEARLKRAEEEKAYMQYYDKILINDDLNRAIKELHEYITTEE